MKSEPTTRQWNYCFSFGCMSPAPLFLIYNSKMGSIVCTSFVHDCIVFFRLYTSYFSSSPRVAEDMLHFFDFVFQNVLNCLYFVSTWLYTSFFVCTPLTFFSTSSWRGWGHAVSSFSDFGFENGLNRLYFVTTKLYTAFFAYNHVLTKYKQLSPFTNPKSKKGQSMSQAPPGRDKKVRGVQTKTYTIMY